MSEPASRLAIAARLISRFRIGLLAVALGMAIILAFYYMQPGERSFLVDSLTLGAELTILEDTSMNTWRLAGGVYICRSDVSNAVQQLAARVPFCPPESFVVERVPHPLNFNLTAGTSLEFISTPGGGLAVFFSAVRDQGGLVIHPAIRPLQLDDIIVLRQDTLTASGSLPFSGSVVVGAEADAGARNLLISGEYAIRELLLGRPDPVNVASGTIHHGDRISFNDPKKSEPVQAFGFISGASPRADPAQQSPFQIIAYTEMGWSEMYIDRFGAVRSVVGSDWTKRAVNDPRLLGATVILSLASLFLSVMGSLAKQLKHRSLDPNTE